MLLVSLTALSCDDDNDDSSNDSSTTDATTNTVEVSATSLTFGVEASSQSITVKASKSGWTSYSAEYSSSWITVETNGTTNTEGTVTISVSENTTTSTRTGQVVVKLGSTRQNIAISQAAPLSLSKTTVYATSAAETVTLTVNGAENWTASADQDWVTTSSSGSILSLSVETNDALTTRTATISVTDGTTTLTAYLTQDAAEDLDIVTPDGYTLVWNDEFNEGTTLSSDWTHEVQSAGWVNNELQTYVDGTSPAGSRVTELKDGKLNINCFSENNNIYSGRVYAKVSEGWKYGYFEARIKLPQGKGTWPAWWMMPANNDYTSNPWPHCGEIDIMEEVGVDANIVSCTIHCTKYNNTNTSTEHASRTFPTAESEYHVYACEWTASEINFIYDGETILTYADDGTGDDQWPFYTAFYPILNLAFGGDWGGYAGVDETILDDGGITMQIDYVRIFQK